MRFLLPSFLFLFLIFPPSVFAQVAITEIMYDPEGADAGSGGEWIEVLNGGSVVADLTQWLFFENETNHSLTADGPALVPLGGYAIISRDPAAFKNYFSGFSGPLFKASFSLNDGETIAMKSGKDAPITDSVTYTAEWGAKNDGNSLQLVSGEWVAAAPTQGEENNAGETAEPPQENTNQSSSVPSGSVSPPASPLFTTRISEKEKFAIIGAGALFKGETIGTTEGLSGKTRFLWNFGDGGTGEGESVLHIYKYPGEYVVVLNAVSGTHSPEDRATVKAIPAEISISNIGTTSDFFIELFNNSAYELNLSGWLLKSGARYFVIPENSFILPKKKIIFPQETTNLSYSAGDIVGLLYPNGLTAAVFSFSAPPEPPPASAVLRPAAVRAPATETTPVHTVSAKTAQQANPTAADTEENATASAAIPQESGEKLPPRNGTPLLWLFGTLAFVTLGAAGVIIARRGKTPADEFTITEEGNDIA